MAKKFDILSEQISNAKPKETAVKTERVTANVGAPITPVSTPVFNIKPFKKPNSDYYRLDLIIRDTVMGAKGHPVMTEQVKTNYKEYLEQRAHEEHKSISDYIHSLIDEDMKKHS